MATLTGARDYATLDVLRNEFIAWVDQHPDFEKWQDAWSAYAHSGYQPASISTAIRLSAQKR